MVDNILVGFEPDGIDINPTNGLFYVTNRGSATVSVIDTSTNIVIATIPVGFLPLDVTVNPTNGLVYVTNGGSNTITVIDPLTNTVIDNIPVKGHRAQLMLIRLMV